MSTLNLSSDTAIDELAATIAEGATVLGMGESTRFGHETFDLRDRLLRRLVHDHAFRALAVQDSAGVGADLDAYVLGEGTAESALRNAWRPWRTAEMVATLEWIRAYNAEHADDPVRILGVKPVQAQPADYDAVLEAVGEAAPDLAAHLDPIRTAHQVDEHVQRARGIHPGRPFAEHARDALALVASVPGLAPDVLARMHLIVEFHERSVAGRGSYASDAEVWAGTVVAYQRSHGVRVAYWDGIGHTSATPVGVGLAPGDGAEPTVGSVLRGRYGTGYVSLGIGFHHGDLGVAVVPDPSPDWVDAKLGATGAPANWLDLRDEPGAWEGPARLRVISGVYDPARDADEHLAVASLVDAFDVLVQVREESAVTWLA